MTFILLAILVFVLGVSVEAGPATGRDEIDSFKEQIVEVEAPKNNMVIFGQRSDDLEISQESGADGDVQEVQEIREGNDNGDNESGNGNSKNIQPSDMPDTSQTGGFGVVNEGVANQPVLVSCEEDPQLCETEEEQIPPEDHPPGEGPSLFPDQTEGESPPDDSESSVGEAYVEP